MDDIINFIVRTLVILIKLILFAPFALITFLIGRSIEKQHYKSLQQREEQLTNIKVFVDGNKFIPSQNIISADLVSGNVVMAADYFKTLLSSIKTLFGGRLNSLESILDRGRREAILRMKEQSKNASYIINVRFETSVISEVIAGKALKVEICAYGTAIYIQNNYETSRN